MRVAAIDVGSNSIHMVVAQVEADGQIRVIDRAKEMVRLGQRTLTSGRLPGEAMRAGLAALANFRTLGERHGVERFRAVATSAVREARNGGDFVEQAERELGLRIEVIPGREEARLIYLGVRHAIDLRGEPVVIVDVGGGSVELVLVENEREVVLDSVKLGVVRLAEEFLAADRPTPRALAELEARITQGLQPFLDRVAGTAVRRVIASSGTLLNLIAVIGEQRGTPLDDHLHHAMVTDEEVARLRRLVVKADRAERLRIRGVEAKRVDHIVIGSLLAERLLRGLGASEMVACTWSLREGVLLDFIAGHRPGIEEADRFVDPRRRSVARFARHLGDVDLHGTHVAGLALQLFDRLQGELRLGDEARDWLEYAALLHDIGHHIGHRDHQRHSHYLISHGELLGFRPEEIRIIALTARFHRKAVPKESDPVFEPLAKPERRVVRALSALLRVADALDRSHFGVVREVGVERRGDRWRIVLRTLGDDAQLERWEARRRVDLLEEILGRRVDFVGQAEKEIPHGE